jgi:predicted hydrocarbon binding protein
LPEVDAFYKFDENEGTIVSKSYGTRAFVLGVEPWSTLVCELLRRFGSAAETILFEIGQSYGASIAQQEKRMEMDDLQKSFHHLARQATIAGWGKVSISIVTRLDLKLRIQKCVFCAEFGDSDERRAVPCFFLNGVISGFSEEFFGPSSSKEIHCSSDYCEYSVKLTKKLWSGKFSENL